MTIYPGFRNARELLERAEKEKQVRELMDKVEAMLVSPECRFEKALETVEQAAAIDADNKRAVELRGKIIEKAMQGLERKISDLADRDGMITDAVALIEKIGEQVPLPPKIKERLSELEQKEHKARKTYQDAVAAAIKARNAPVADAIGRGARYGDAKRFFNKAIEINRNLASRLSPELDRLEKEEKEWHDYLEAAKLFEEKKFEACLERLAPYRNRSQLPETREFLIQVLNQLGFGGPFLLKIFNIEHVVIPDDEILVGRNTRLHSGNHIALKVPCVSRNHGKITRKDSRFFYEEIKPQHGTMLEGRFIDGAVEIKDGDILAFGYFKNEDGSSTGEPPEVRLRVSYLSGDAPPSAKVEILPSDCQDFRENTLRFYILTGDEIFLGRDETNAVQIPDPSTEPVHARLKRSYDQWFIEDMDTPTGIMVNDEPLSGHRALQLGDRIRIGNIETTVLEFRTDKP